MWHSGCCAPSHSVLFDHRAPQAGSHAQRISPTATGHLRRRQQMGTYFPSSSGRAVLDKTARHGPRSPATPRRTPCCLPTRESVGLALAAVLVFDYPFEIRQALEIVRAGLHIQRFRKNRPSGEFCASANHGQGPTGRRHKVASQSRIPSLLYRPKISNRLRDAARPTGQHLAPPALQYALPEVARVRNWRDKPVVSPLPKAISCKVRPGSGGPF